jgi:beta-lactamase regulating signal transducer with metallopeptidase domain
MPPPVAELVGALVPPVVAGAAWVVNWLATYAVHSTILILAAWVACRSSLGARLSASQRTAIWRGTLLAGIVTATLQRAEAFAPLTGTMRLAPELDSQVMFGMFVTATGDPSAGPAAIATRIEVRPLWPIVTTLVWMTCVGAGWVLLLVARRRFLRRLGSRRSGEMTVAGHALRELQRRAGMRRPVQLRMTSHLHSPVAVGRDEIYLPERALAEFDLPHLESMLAHELAHLERRDAMWLAVARTIEVIFFFQPLNRLARRRMVEAEELAADAWAIGITARPVTLARCLARVAEWTSAERLSHAPAMVENRSSSLVQRVRVLTAGPRPADAVSERWVRAAMLGMVAAAALLAPRAAIGRAGALPDLRARRIEFRVHQAGAGAADLSPPTSGRGAFLIRLAPPR